MRGALPVPVYYRLGENNTFSTEKDVSLDLTAASNIAQQAAIAAESLIGEFLQRGDWAVELKQDDSPVTDVDIAAERCIKNILSQAMPGTAFFGEETGHSPGARSSSSNSSTEAESNELQTQSRWLVDPIDGTKSFIRGMPFYSTQIALEVDGELCVGVSNAPAYKERLVAVTGQGVWLNEAPVACSAVTQLGDAFLSSGNLASLAGDPAAWLRYGNLLTKVRRIRGYGDFCHYHQLCCGQTDLIIESDVNILDIAALCVGIREAGGIITDLSGQAIDAGSTSVLAACTVELHEHALSMLLGSSESVS